MVPMDEILSGYLSAWNEKSQESRMALLEKVCSKDVVLLDPRGEFVGRESIAAYIGQVQSQLNYHRVEYTSQAQLHQQAPWLWYNWAIVISEAKSIEGMDVVELNGEGRIDKIVSFDKRK